MEHIKVHTEDPADQYGSMKRDLWKLLLDFKIEFLAEQKRILEETLAGRVPYPLELPISSLFEKDTCMNKSSSTVNEQDQLTDAGQKAVSLKVDDEKTSTHPSENSLFGSVPLGELHPASSERDDLCVGRQSSARSFQADSIARSTLSKNMASKSARITYSAQDLDTFYKSSGLRPGDFVRSATFDAICGVVILSNAILISIDTEYLAREGEASESFDTIQLILNIWYAIELILRFAGHGKAFLCGEEKYWNYFDTLLVLSAVVDLFLSKIFSSDFKATRLLRAVRLCRIVRTLRIIRTLKYIREFRKMVYSLVASFQTLTWSLFMIFGVMYSFNLWFTQNAAYMRFDSTELPEDSQHIEELTKYYSTFGRTSYTLFAAISGGYSWHVLLDPWIAADAPLTVALFFMYISLTTLGLMNIVTSVFVESAMHATKHFQELLLDANKKEHELYRFHMKRIFTEIDTDNSGSMSYEEMRTCLQDGVSE